MANQTLYDKLWDQHVVATREDGSTLLYIDLHLVHEVTSPQPFAALREASRKPRRLDAILGMVDHSVPTRFRGDVGAIADDEARIQVRTLHDNAEQFGFPFYPWSDNRQGIVHVVAPEQGATLPGMTVVCGDSHTSTHGALGVLAMGIGTTNLEHVLATQTLPTYKLKNLSVKLNGALSDDQLAWLLPKDIALALIGKIGIGGGSGCAMELSGPIIDAMSMEGRMTLCNLAVEAGSRCGLIAVDDTTIEYVRNKPLAPKNEEWDMAQDQWRHLHSDPDANWDVKVNLDVSDLGPQVTWGTAPDMVTEVGGSVPDPDKCDDALRSQQMREACNYMGLHPGTNLADLGVDHIFIGACTNSRLEDLRAAAKIVSGKKVAKSVKRALVVPGSAVVRQQAEAEGLDQIFLDAGFEWREPGCSMCLGMNDDVLEPQERCVSTANRNFEGRAGPGGRIHLASPYTAAASAIAGHIAHPNSVI